MTQLSFIRILRKSSLGNIDLTYLNIKKMPFMSRQETSTSPNGIQGGRRLKNLKDNGAPSVRKMIEPIRASHDVGEQSDKTITTEPVRVAAN